MTRIADYLSNVRTAQEWAADQNAKIEGDWRLSDAAKREAKEYTRQDLQGSVTRAVQGLFGKMGPTGLEGGTFWRDRDAITARIKAARDAADTLDPARVANAHRRIGAITARARNLGDVAEWYQNADSYERRALQDLGAEAIPSKFHNEGGLGGFLGDLERDRAQSLRTPELVEAQTALENLNREGYEAHRELARAVGANDAFSIAPAAQTLRGVRVGMQITDASRMDAPIKYSVEKDPNAVPVHWPDSAGPTE